VLLLIAMVTLALAPFPAAASESSLLDGESLIVSNSMGGADPIDGTTAGEFSCGSTSDLSMTITGYAYGPYPGTFTQTIDAQIVDEALTAFDVTFTIDSGTTTVTGDAHYSGPEVAALCSAYYDEDDGWIYRFGAGSGGSGFDALPLEYSATIVGDLGTEEDTGPVQAGVNLYCLGSATFATNCDVATTILRFEDAAPPPPPPSDPPVIESVSFPTTFVNGPAPVTITVTATITDDFGVLEGGCIEIDPEEGGGQSCGGSSVAFRAPRGDASAVGWFTHVSDDTYEAEVTFPPYAAIGTWTVLIDALDADYNEVVLQTDDLVGLGWPSAVEVAGTDDTAPPELIALSAPNKLTVDTGDPNFLNRSLSITAEASDDLSGVYYLVITLVSDTGDTTNAGFDPMGGGMYEADVFFDGNYQLGVWRLQGIYLEDAVGNRQTVTPPTSWSIDVIRSVSGTVAAGETFSSADGLDDTPLLLAEITSPTGGLITVVTSLTGSPTAGYSMLGFQVDITAPPATVEQPLSLLFLIQPALIPDGVAASDITVLRNGQPAAACSGAVGTASPDPCVSERSITGEGAVAITVLTSHASTWAFGVSDGSATARSLKQAALSALQGMAVDAKALKALASATDAVSASLADSLWIDDGHLSLNGGTKVFDAEKRAVKELTRKELSAYSQTAAVIGMLLDADRLLAQTAIDDAVAANAKPKDVQMASDALSKADAARASGRYEQAIDGYKAAWERAQKAHK
jgi:hypothetical protein